MGFKFRKSIKIAPGIKLNFNKKSTGITFGGKGLHYTINSKGKRTKSVGIPGTGLYYSTSSSGSKSNKKKTSDRSINTQNFVNKENKNMSDKKWYQKNWVIILLIIYFFPVGLYLMWKHTNWKKGIKVFITSVFAFYLIMFSIGFSAMPDIETTTDVNVVASTTEATTETTTETTTEEITTTEPTTTETTTETTTRETTTETTTKETTTEKITTTEAETEYYYEEEEDTYYEEEEEEAEMVWIPKSGSKYHSYSGCSNMKNPSEVTIDTAKSRGYSACSKCW